MTFKLALGGYGTNISELDKARASPVGDIFLGLTKLHFSLPAGHQNLCILILFSDEYSK
jgi:hypothetical protein